MGRMYPVLFWYMDMESKGSGCLCLPAPGPLLSPGSGGRQVTDWKRGSYDRKKGIFMNMIRRVSSYILFFGVFMLLGCTSVFALPPAFGAQHTDHLVRHVQQTGRGTVFGVLLNHLRPGHCAGAVDA